MWMRLLFQCNICLTVMRIILDARVAGWLTLTNGQKITESSYGKIILVPIKQELVSAAKYNQTCSDSKMMNIMKKNQSPTNVLKRS